MSIVSFSDSVTQEFFVNGRVKKGVGWATIVSVTRRKLDMLHYAADLLDLRAPPANRLEALKGELTGYFSIRINYQWRVVFKWTSAGPSEVRVCDYH